MMHLANLGANDSNGGVHRSNDDLISRLTRDVTQRCPVESIGQGRGTFILTGQSQASHRMFDSVSESPRLVKQEIARKDAREAQRSKTLQEMPPTTETSV